MKAISRFFKFAIGGGILATSAVTGGLSVWAFNQPGNSIIDWAILRNQLTASPHASTALTQSRNPEISPKRPRGPTSDVVGLDTGDWLPSEPGNSLEISHACNSLKQWGVCFLPATAEVKKSSQETWKFLLSGEPITTATQLGKRLLALDPEISHYRPYHNRLHLMIKGSALFDEKKFPGLVPQMHQSFGIIEKMAESEKPGNSLFLADARIVVVDAAGKSAPWALTGGLIPQGREISRFADKQGIFQKHFQGYTVITPLTDITENQGGWKFLPGSHLLGETEIAESRKLFLTRFTKCGGIKSVFDFGKKWDIGSALILDNRTLAKSQGSDSFKPGIFLCVSYEYSNGLNSQFPIRSPHFAFSAISGKIGEVATFFLKKFHAKHQSVSANVPVDIRV